MKAASAKAVVAILALTSTVFEAKAEDVADVLRRICVDRALTDRSSLCRTHPAHVRQTTGTAAARPATAPPAKAGSDPVLVNGFAGFIPVVPVYGSLRGVGLIQHFFARADVLDNPAPGFESNIKGAQALGASFSYAANDYVQSASGTTTSSSVTAMGLLSYAPFERALTLSRDYTLQLVPTIQVEAKGNWDHPQRAFVDESALKVGPSFTFQYGFGDNALYTDVTPYHQTDFYGRAAIDGVSVGLTPFIPELGLQQAAAYNPDRVFGSTALFVVHPGFSFVDVARPGQTNLRAKRYEWLGGEARAYLLLFTKDHEDQFASFLGALTPYLEDRVAIVGTYKGYADLTSKTVAHLLSASAQYRLSCLGPGCTGGTTSLGLQYDYGTDRDVLLKQKKIQAKLSFAY